MAIFVLYGVMHIVSCKKSNDNSGNGKSGDATNLTAADSLALGYWFGSFDQGSYNQSMLFTPNGKVKVYDFYYHPTSTDTTIAYDGYGYWSVSGTTLTVVDSFDNGQKFTSIMSINTTASPETLTDNNTGDVYHKQ